MSAPFLIESLKEEISTKIVKAGKGHQPSFDDMHKDEPNRRPSINVYQSIKNDHNNLQSIQNLVNKRK